MKETKREYTVIDVYIHEDEKEREEALRRNLLRAGRALQLIRKSKEKAQG